jgi:pyruvate,water dikinase
VGQRPPTLGGCCRAGFDVPAGFVIADPIGDDGWGREIESALLDLGPGSFAVRSSAFGEDGGQASFAGQLDTTLGATTTAQVVQAARRTARSGAGPKVTGYAARTGHAAGSVVPVIVQVMVEPEAAGVLFTRHPVSGADEVVIEAAGGLGDKVVDGTVTPQAWTVDGGGITGPGHAEAPVLTRAQVRTLGRIGRRIEAVFDVPQDIEWAVADRKVWILQARPITTRPEEATPVPSEPGKVLLRGTPASPGIALGPARVITGLDDFDQFRPGDVLVCRTTAPAWTPLLARATAVVTEIGGMLAHAAIVAREFGIPAVLAAPGAMTVLADGQQVVVDGSAGTVTDGTNRKRNR